MGVVLEKVSSWSQASAREPGCRQTGRMPEPSRQASIYASCCARVNPSAYSIAKIPLTVKWVVIRSLIYGDEWADNSPTYVLKRAEHSGIRAIR